MPDRYVLDAHAWVEYLRGSSPGKRIKDIVDKEDIYTSAVTLAEVVSHVQKEGADSELAARAIKTISSVVDLDSDLAISAAKIQSKGKEKKSLEQAYILATARKFDAQIISGDQSIATRKINLIK